MLCRISSIVCKADPLNPYAPSCVLSHSVVSDSLQPPRLQPARLLCPWIFSRQDYWSGFPCPPPWDLPNPGIKPRSPALQADSLLSEPAGKPTCPWLFKIKPNYLQLKPCLFHLYGLNTYDFYSTSFGVGLHFANKLFETIKSSVLA